MTTGRLHLLGSVAVLLLYGASEVARSQVAVPRVALLATDPPPPRFPVVKFIGFFEGQVVRITKKEVVIRAFFHIDFKAKRVYTGREDTEEFYFSKPLADGDRPKTYPPIAAPVDSSYGYRATQIKMCDIVDIMAYKVDGRRECGAISIIRRTDGQVPLAQDQKDHRYGAWHRRCQAYQAFEEHGVPLMEQLGGIEKEKKLTARLKTVKEILEAAKDHDKK